MRRFLEWIDTKILPDPVVRLVSDKDAADLIRGHQIAALKNSGPGMAAATIINILIAIVVLRDSANFMALLVWGVCSLSIVWWGIFKSLKGRFKPAKIRPVKSTDKAVFNAFAMGIIWATLPILSFNDATSTERVFITCVTAGMMGGGALVFSILPAAATAICLTIGAGALITLLSSGDLVLMTTGILLCNFAYALISAASNGGTRFVKSRLNETKIKNSNATIGLLLKQFEDGASDWIWETNAQGKFVNPSKRFVEVSELTSDAIETKTLSDFARDLAIEEHRKSRSYNPALVRELLEKKQEFHELTIGVRCGDKTKWWMCSGQPYFDLNDKFGGYRGVASDVSERVEAEMKLSHLARYDQLTGLSNRSDFLERLRSDILQQGDQGNSIALLYVDLDRFKAINDTLGHSVGDEVLRETARRITRSLDTMSYAARFGGDEFAIALHCENGSKQAEAVCGELIHLLKLPFEVDGHQLSFGASIGIAMSEGAHEGPEQVIHNADLALYRAKSSGRGSYKVFETNMDLAMRERRELETQLRSATANKEFTLHYQPIVDLPFGKIIGYEALIRWDNPQLGQVQPDRFIPIAEESGLIHDIGDWVINQACRDAKSWKGQQKVAINLSGNQLRSYRIVQRVIAALAETGLPPHRLELEVTESVLLGDSETTMGLLENLRSLGVKISLDDFGTGYSSLAYLVQFPFDKIKIDKSFVQAAGENGESLAIVRAILSLAKALKMTTLAEGIETQEQLSLLQKEGCEQVQGYFLGKPMPISELAPDSQSRRLKVA